METTENTAVMRRIFDEVVNGKNLDLADELYAEEHVLHPQSFGVGRGAEGMKQAFAGLHEEFPDVTAQIESLVADGDLVAVRLTFIGTQGSTGDRTAWPEMVFTRFADGKAVESWEVADVRQQWSDAPW